MHSEASQTTTLFLTSADLDTLAAFVEDRRQLKEWVSSRVSRFLVVSVLTIYPLMMTERAGRASASP